MATRRRVTHEENRRHIRTVRAARIGRSFLWVAQVTIIQVTLVSREFLRPLLSLTVVNARHCPPGRITARKPGTSLVILNELLASAVLVRFAHGSRSQALCSVLSRQCYDAPAMTETGNVYGGDGDSTREC